MKAQNESIKQTYELKRKNYNRNATETLATYDNVTEHEAEILFTDQIRIWLYDEDDISHQDDFKIAGHYNSGDDLILADDEVVNRFTIGDWHYYLEVNHDRI